MFIGPLIGIASDLLQGIVGSGGAGTSGIHKAVGTARSASSAEAKAQAPFEEVLTSLQQSRPAGVMSGGGLNLHGQ